MLDPIVVGVIVFVLASFIGFEVITKVPPTLHTPLMSGSNAISGLGASTRMRSLKPLATQSPAGMRMRT